MTSVLFLPFVAAVFTVVLACASVLRKTPSPATWFFFTGMLALGADSVVTGYSLRVTDLTEVVGWLTLGLIIESVIPGIWLGFGVTYSRGDSRESFWRWRAPMILIGLVPLAFALLIRGQMFALTATADGSEGRLVAREFTRALNVVLLVGLMLALMNIEATFRAAVGTARWRIKYVVLGLGAIFGSRIYVHAQSVLFSAPDLPFWSVESGGLLIGCVFLAVAYARTGFAEIDVYPSLAALRSSITVLLVGSYLLVVGLMAQVARRFGGAENLEFQTLVVLIGMSGLALLLLSDRARQRIHLLAVRNFSKTRHDSLRIWTKFSERLANVRDTDELCDASVTLISETFDAMSVTAWLADSDLRRLTIGASTTRSVAPGPTDVGGHIGSHAIATALATRTSPFDLNAVQEPWAEEFRRLNPVTFSNGGSRWCIPLCSDGQSVGALVLADRVSGAPYSTEELELLKCIGDQITSVLVNLRLAREIANAKELEAFQAMSTFFVHDLKNAAASLNLTLKNLPVHFDDPEFRADALRGFGNTARRIEEMIERLGAFRQRPSLAPVATDLNRLVAETLSTIQLRPDVDVATDFKPLPIVAVDREQMKSVVTNLLMNAAEASHPGGHIRVQTDLRDGRVILSVSDTGAGMSAAFVQNQLFRPFQSTKKTGLGIGLFQCRAVAQAHGGAIDVVSEIDVGTTFSVTLPTSPRE